MRSNIETLLSSGWSQVATLSAAVTDTNLTKLNFLLDRLPIAEDLLLTYRCQKIAVTRLQSVIAAENTKEAPAVINQDVIDQANADIRRAQSYMLQCDARMEIILYEYGKL